MPAVKVGILWPGDPRAPTPAPESTRFRRVFEELAARDVLAEPIVYADEVVDGVGERLLHLDAVLVWVNPIVDGRDRTVVDPLLRYWAQDTRPIPLYHAATWGPREAEELVLRDGRRWRRHD